MIHLLIFDNIKFCRTWTWEISAKNNKLWKNKSHWWLEWHAYRLDKNDKTMFGDCVLFQTRERPNMPHNDVTR